MVSIHGNNILYSQNAMVIFLDCQLGSYLDFFLLRPDEADMKSAFSWSLFDFNIDFMSPGKLGITLTVTSIHYCSSFDNPSKIYLLSLVQLGFVSVSSAF